MINELTKEQIKLLKYLYRKDTVLLEILGKKFSFDSKNTLSESYQAMFDLRMCKLVEIYWKSDNSYDTIEINTDGKIFVENHTRQSRMFWIPTVISILALWATFMTELLWLLQQLMRLLK